MNVEGLDRVVGRLKFELEQAKGERTERAVNSMLLVGGQHASELTPIDSSTLINSQYRRTWETDVGLEGAVYYEAFYAGWVHEMPGTLKGLPRAAFGTTKEGFSFGGGTGKGNYWDPDAEPHFLRKGMEEMAAEAPAILQAAYAVN